MYPTIRGDKFDNSKKQLFSITPDGYDHQYIATAGAGASEFLYYITMYKLSKYYNLTIFYLAKSKTLDDVEYTEFNSDNVSFIKNINNSPFIVQRDFNLLIKLFDSNDSNKYMLWTHDHNYHETGETMEKFIKYKIPIIVISNYHKKHWEGRYTGITTHIIHNALFPEFFPKDETIQYNKDHIIVASGWASRDMSKVFQISSEYYKKNNNYRLILITPSYSPDSDIDQDKYPFILKKGNLKDKGEYSKLLQSCLCVFSTSTSETFGCVFAEALHLGVPVIIDNTNSGPNEVVPAEYILDFNNTEAVIDRIEEYRQNRPKVFLNEKFYEKAIIQEWRNFIDSL
jgi:glycosyltransferase involved in cell wall biosynthesis